MERLSLLVCLSLICVSVASELKPRGTRPVEQGTRADKCDTQREWPFCTDDQWGPKCPSGCRIHGLMNDNDHSLLKKIEKIRSLLDQSKAKYRSTDQTSKTTYNFLRDKLTIDSGDGDKYVEFAQNLRIKISNMKIKIEHQLKILANMKDRIKDQVDRILTLEVDIDIKLRSCKGSCAGHTEYSVDHVSHTTLDKQVNQLEAQSAQRPQSVETLYVLKSKSMDEATVAPIYKATDGVEVEPTEDKFTGVSTKLLILEPEDPPTSPAIISKNSGTSSSYSASSSSSSVNAASTSSSSTTITELSKAGNGDFFDQLTAFGVDQTQVTSKTVSCTKRTVVSIKQTSSGPEEEVEEVVEGGPECQVMTDTSQGMGAFFPNLQIKTSTSSKTMGDFLKDSKGLFGSDLSDDFGLFHTDRAEEDVPDIQARSLRTATIDRQPDFIGTDCVEAHQRSLNGEKNGLFEIRPGGINSTEVVVVYCEQEGLMGGWLLVQQRESGALSFNRTWEEYRNGFGSVDMNGKGEFWLGNQNLHLLTSQRETMLKVEMQDWEGGEATAEYIARVGSEEEGYPIHISGYTGDAGDALLKSHNKMKFSTFDKDNDNWAENCAEWYGGGWWYNSCQAANLNGIYYKGTYEPQKNMPYKIENGVVWLPYKPAEYSLKHIRILIRRSDF